MFNFLPLQTLLNLLKKRLTDGEYYFSYSSFVASSLLSNLKKVYSNNNLNSLKIKV